MVREKGYISATRFRFNFILDMILTYEKVKYKLLILYYLLERIKLITFFTSNQYSHAVIKDLKKKINQ